MSNLFHLSLFLNNFTIFCSFIYSLCLFLSLSVCYSHSHSSLFLSVPLTLLESFAFSSIYIFLSISHIQFSSTYISFIPLLYLSNSDLSLCFSLSLSLHLSYFSFIVQQFDYNQTFSLISYHSFSHTKVFSLRQRL